MEALARALPETVGDRRTIAVVSILDDKDPAGMLRAPLRKTSGALVTPRRNRRARGRGAGARARGAGRRRARDRLDLSRRGPAGGAFGPAEVGAVNDRGPSVLAMVALVAIVVALVILVFFAIGY